MKPEDERAYVRRWVETGRLLEERRWQELRELSPEAALCATDALLEAVLRIPVPPERVRWSGLIALQDALHARRPR